MKKPPGGVSSRRKRRLGRTTARENDGSGNNGLGYGSDKRQA